MLNKQGELSSLKGLGLRIFEWSEAEIGEDSERAWRAVSQQYSSDLADAYQKGRSKVASSTNQRYVDDLLVSLTSILQEAKEGNVTAKRLALLVGKAVAEYHLAEISKELEST